MNHQGTENIVQSGPVSIHALPGQAMLAQPLVKGQDFRIIKTVEYAGEKKGRGCQKYLRPAHGKGQSVQIRRFDFKFIVNTNAFRGQSNLTHQPIQPRVYPMVGGAHCKMEAKQADNCFQWGMPPGTIGRLALEKFVNPILKVDLPAERLCLSQPFLASIEPAGVLQPRNIL